MVFFPKRPEPTLPTRTEPTTLTHQERLALERDTYIKARRNYTATFAYDAGGNITTITTAKTVLTFTYDSGGNIISIEDSGRSQKTSLTYNPDGTIDTVSGGPVDAI